MYIDACNVAKINAIAKNAGTCVYIESLANYSTSPANERRFTTTPDNAKRGENNKNNENAARSDNRQSDNVEKGPEERKGKGRRSAGSQEGATTKEGGDFNPRQRRAARSRMQRSGVEDAALRSRGRPSSTGTVGVWKVGGGVVRVEGCSHGKGPGGREAVGVEGRAGVLVCVAVVGVLARWKERRRDRVIYITRVHVWACCD